MHIAPSPYFLFSLVRPNRSENFSTHTSQFPNKVQHARNSHHNMPPSGWSANTSCAVATAAKSSSKSEVNTTGLSSVLSNNSSKSENAGSTSVTQKFAPYIKAIQALMHEENSGQLGILLIDLNKANKAIKTFVMARSYLDSMNVINPKRTIEMFEDCVEKADFQTFPFAYNAIHLAIEHRLQRMEGDFKNAGPDPVLKRHLTKPLKSIQKRIHKGLLPTTSNTDLKLLVSQVDVTESAPSLGFLLSEITDAMCEKSLVNLHTLHSINSVATDLIEAFLKARLDLLKLGVENLRGAMDGLKEYINQADPSDLSLAHAVSELAIDPQQIEMLPLNPTLEIEPKKKLADRFENTLKQW